jgi:hypothetical protein
MGALIKKLFQTPPKIEIKRVPRISAKSSIPSDNAKSSKLSWKKQEILLSLPLTLCVEYKNEFYLQVLKLLTTYFKYITTTLYGNVEK